MPNDWLQLMSDLTDLTSELMITNKPLLDETFKGYPLNEIELLERIAQLPTANVTLLAQASHMTRGAISKIAKKLVAQKLIERYQDVENKKEVYFRLTASGKALQQRHHDLHKQFLARDQAVYQNFSEEDYAVLSRFIQRYRSHLAEK